MGLITWFSMTQRASSATGTKSSWTPFGSWILSITPKRMRMRKRGRLVPQTEMTRTRRESPPGGAHQATGMIQIRGGCATNSASSSRGDPPCSPSRRGATSGTVCLAATWMFCVNGRIPLSPASLRSASSLWKGVAWTSTGSTGSAGTWLLFKNYDTKLIMMCLFELCLCG
ncbi:hypothetical protein JZ751_013204 [Albula glossodonta]|uniref:Uncharacterized protein n=1 Tax=Albula glossodonta TaxID=121402 RepID=A0A8T2NSB3_9TELE|nr:hypothetical protein JZ751_013204 [Albula glossodonta]